MTFEEYQQIDAINATAIKAGQKSMLHMRTVMTGKRTDETPAMRWGRIIHSAVLEPNYADSLAVYTGAVKRGKAWDEFAVINAGREIVTLDERAELTAIINAVQANPHAKALIDGSEHEMTVQWDDECGHCKARLDGWAPYSGIIEIKTTGAITANQFARQYINMGHDLQVGWYSRAIEKTTGKKPDVTIIAIESSPPFDVAVWTLNRAAVVTGERHAIEIANRYAACCKAVEWPGVQEDGPEELTLPEWYAFEGVCAAYSEMAAAEL